MSMARLWRDQVERNAAHRLLAAVHGWFDPLDRQEAKALLPELTS
jgi:hypothetical protein